VNSGPHKVDELPNKLAATVFTQLPPITSKFLVETPETSLSFTGTIVVDPPAETLASRAEIYTCAYIWSSG